MDLNCPNCHNPLQQLGHVEDAGRGKAWVGENLYRCQDCKYGSNRFVIRENAVVPAMTEGWLT